MEDGDFKQVELPTLPASFKSMTIDPSYADDGVSLALGVAGKALAAVEARKGTVLDADESVEQVPPANLVSAREALKRAEVLVQALSEDHEKGPVHFDTLVAMMDLAQIYDELGTH